MSNVLDGNAAAGALSEIFTPDVTSAVTTCAGCGERSHVGALRAYMGAPGVVLRCRSCDAVQVRFVSSAGRAWLDLQGVRVLQLRGEP